MKLRKLTVNLDQLMQARHHNVSPQTIGDVVPAYSFTLPIYAPPFHLEPEPCSTPPEPDPEQFIQGCISKNGTLKIVADPADCRARETPLSWLGQ